MSAKKETTLSFVQEEPVAVSIELDDLLLEQLDEVVDLMRSWPAVRELGVVVTRETAAGTFSLVCTSVRAVSEGGAEQRDGMPALMGQYHQKFDFWPKRRSLPPPRFVVPTTGL